MKKKTIQEIEAELYQYNGEDRVVSSFDIRDEINKDTVPQWSLFANMKRLDKYINGFLGGEVTVISGTTGEGKTTLCQTLTTNFYARNQGSVWFSYEVRPKLFIAQFGQVLPDFYMPRKLKEKSMQWIADRVYEAKLKYNIKAVFVDHLHYLLDMAKTYNVSLQIGDIMRSIVNMAHDLNIHFFLIAHTEKIKNDGTVKEPMKGDTRDSSFIEQEADNVLYVWRLPAFENMGMIKIAKNRRMGTFDKKIMIEKEGDYFTEANYDANALSKKRIAKS